MEMNWRTSEANVARSNGCESDSSYFSLLLSPLVYTSDVFEWMLDSVATYHMS